MLIVLNVLKYELVVNKINILIILINEIDKKNQNKCKQTYQMGGGNANKQTKWAAGRQCQLEYWT